MQMIERNGLEGLLRRSIDTTNVLIPPAKNLMGKLKININQEHFLILILIWCLFFICFFLSNRSEGSLNQHLKIKHPELY